MISTPFGKEVTKKASTEKPRSFEEFLKVQPRPFKEAPPCAELLESPEDLLPCENLHSNL